MSTANQQQPRVVVFSTPTCGYCNEIIHRYAAKGLHQRRPLRSGSRQMACLDMAVALDQLGNPGDVHRRRVVLQVQAGQHFLNARPVFGNQRALAPKLELSQARISQVKNGEWVNGDMKLAIVRLLGHVPLDLLEDPDIAAFRKALSRTTPTPSRFARRSSV